MSEHRGSSCGDELGLDALATADPSRKKHKDSGVDGEQIGRGAVAKLRNYIWIYYIYLEEDRRANDELSDTTRYV